MSVISPQAMLLWATLSSTLLLFLVQHLYRYDRFQCLKWRSSSDGGFKRFMTFSYIISVPLLVVYSVAMAVMKYQAGYKAFPNPASTPSNPLPRIIVATPTEMWPQAHQNLVFPLYVIFAVAWALEIVSHLEELCFWLFMIKEQGGGESVGGVRPWFRSFEYKLWGCGSLGALVLLPLVTIGTRRNVQQVEAWTFFAGSVCSLIITLWFIQVLWKFPAFLKRIQAEDAEPEVIVRLSAFQDLNRLRIVFRLMFVLPLLVLACDGLNENGPHVIITTAGAADILAMVGGIGCVVSSVITLLVFFPRSIARESGYATRARTHTSQMQSKSGAGPVTKSNPQSKPPRQTTSIPPPQQPLSPGSSQFQSMNGITSQLRSPSGVGELRSHGSIAVQRPAPVHRRTTSNSGPAPVSGDPLTSAVSAQQPPALRIPRRPYVSPATPDDAPGTGVHVTVQTTVRGDSQYFERPGGTVVLGDEELPAYVGEGLSDSKGSRPRNRSGSSGTSEGGEEGGAEASQGDYFAASGASVIRLGSMSGVPLVRGSGSHGRERVRAGLHPLLVNYTSPIDLHVEDDAQIGRAV